MASLSQAGVTRRTSARTECAAIQLAEETHPCLCVRKAETRAGLIRRIRRRRSKHGLHHTARGLQPYDGRLPANRRVVLELPQYSCRPKAPSRTPPTRRWSIAAHPACIRPPLWRSRSSHSSPSSATSYSPVRQSAPSVTLAEVPPPAGFVIAEKIGTPGDIRARHCKNVKHQRRRIAQVSRDRLGGAGNRGIHIVDGREKSELAARPRGRDR